MTIGTIGQMGPTGMHVERFAQLIEKRLGLRFDEAKLGFLADVLHRRLQVRGGSVETYLDEMAAGPFSEDEIAALASELTVAETYFFRNVEQFRALGERVFPELMSARTNGRRLKVLSAGCASGEEPYSIAMLAQDVLRLGWKVDITAVDLNPRVLEKAVRAQFSAWVLRETVSEMQQRWFRREGSDFVLDDIIRRAVTFERHNLADEWAAVWQPSAFDVVFCRNVMMYFSREHAERLIACIARSLAPGGYLFLGHAETLRGLSGNFHLCHTHDTFYYRLKDAADQTIADAMFPEVSSPLPEVPPLAAFLNADSWIDMVHSVSERVREISQARNDAAPAWKPPAVVARPRWDLGMALELLQRERFAEALELIGRLPPESDRDPDVLLLRAVLLTHSGQLRSAEECCRTLLHVDEMSAGAHYLLALCREGTGDRKGAAEQDQMAVYLDPGFAMPRLHLGLLARREGRQENARRQLRQAFTLLHQEDASKLLLFGGGFSREMLVTLCREELAASGGQT